ncbi:MAG: hypothetical protein ABI321_19250 [Polyangia bacterium]
MNDFFPEIALSQPAAEAIARGLYAVAKVDGLHEREEALVASFWSDVGGGAAALAALERGAAISVAELGAALPEKEQRQLFVKTSLLLAWADGKITDEEKKIIGEFATGLDIDGAALAKLETSVKEFLLSHLSPIHNTEAVAEVAKKLGI